ncbi:MAG: ShlB/FhaC/HecB family hemolysin secretion/activation protein [Duodenibacillus sp.]|nr:ShlB/FhaC/HecB family hemolysin secretion/activation protein [Duodenibacillus sp.]
MTAPISVRTLVVLLASSLCVATAQANVASRDLQQLEKERDRAQLRHELDAMRDQQNKAPSPETKPAVVPKGDFQFQLKKLSHTPSSVLTDEEIAVAVEPWVGKVVRSKDIADLLEAVNRLYRDKGYAVCQAGLRPQRIRDGNLTITLVEGKTDEVVVRGLESTNLRFVERVFDMPKGEVANYRDMYDDLVRFNMTNDIRLSIDIHPGQAPETTAYDIIAQEPARWSTSVFADTHGSDSTGRYRAGASIVNRSVFGWRDSFYLMGIASEGSKNALIGYSIPFNSFGTRLIANASFGDVEIIEGPSKANDVSGDSFHASLRLEHPFAVGADYKWIGYGEIKHQQSQTDMYGDVRIARTAINALTAGLDALYIGEGWALYANNRLSQHRAEEKLFDNTFDYTLFSGDFFVQKQLPHGFSVQATASWQAKLGGDEMVSSDQFYLGNSAGVRGYPNDVISADNGLYVNLQANCLLTDYLETYVFFDAGRLSGMSAFNKRTLTSVGVGVNWQPARWVRLKGVIAAPLSRQVSDIERVDSVRYDAVLTLQF